jgi:hypothetical protein
VCDNIVQAFEAATRQRSARELREGTEAAPNWRQLTDAPEALARGADWTARKQSLVNGSSGSTPAAPRECAWWKERVLSVGPVCSHANHTPITRNPSITPRIPYVSGTYARSRVGSIPIARSNSRQRWPTTAKTVRARRRTEMLAHVGLGWVPLHTRLRLKGATARTALNCGGGANEC